MAIIHGNYEEVTTNTFTLQEQIHTLKESIKKWEGIVAGTMEDDGINNCACCAKFFFFLAYEHCCYYCPIAWFSGAKGCNATPYIEFCDAEDAFGEGSAARAELAYLQEVLDALEAETQPVNFSRRMNREIDD